MPPRLPRIRTELQALYGSKEIKVGMLRMLLPMNLRMRAIVCWASILIAGCDMTAQSDRQSAPATRGDVSTFSLGVTDSIVNVPWILASRENLITDTARRHGVRLEIVEFNSEKLALRAFREGNVDAITTNINALLSDPALARRDTILPLLFGYSHGDYAIYSRQSSSPAALVNQTIHLPFGSTGHYFLFRMLELNQLTMADVQLADTPEEQLLDEVINGSVDTLVASGRTLAQMQQLDDFRLVADSRSLYNEIMAGLAIDQRTADQHPQLAAALVESWFVIMEAFFDGSDQLTANYVEQTALLSNLQPATVSRYLGVHTFMQTADYALQLMEGDNLNQLLLGANRFIDASIASQCTAESAGACHIERDGSIINYGDGGTIVLDTRALQNLIE